MDGLPFQLPTQAGTELFPDATQSPPIMTLTIEEPQNLRDDPIDPCQGSESNSYGMGDGQSPKTPGDNVPAKDPGSACSEAKFVAQQMVSAASGQIRGFYMSQRHNASLSTCWIHRTRGTATWGHMDYTKALRMEELDVVVSANAISAELRKRHNLFHNLLAAQFEDGEN